MSDINVASKSAAEAEHAPYLCPHCEKPADQIMMTHQPGLAILWHGDVHCRKIIACWPMPQRSQGPQPLIAVPKVGLQ